MTVVPHKEFRCCSSSRGRRQHDLGSSNNHLAVAAAAAAAAGGGVKNQQESDSNKGKNSCCCCEEITMIAQAGKVWMRRRRRSFPLLPLLLLLLLQPSEASVLTEMEKPVPIRDVEAVLGGKAELPCDILPEDAHDDVYLVLWFKDEATKPMYSLDVRGKPLDEASHWSESSSLGQRSTFRTQSSPNSLVVDELSLQDEGIYRCRVDYRNSPTKNVKLNLTIIVPPEKPVIRNREGQELPSYELGPFEVDQDLVLDCEVTGGTPAPKVTWWKEGVLYDSSDKLVTANPSSSGGGGGSSVIVNRLVYKGLRREDLGAKFVCQAVNTNRTAPVARELKLVLNLKPTSLSILSKPTHVSADKELEVVCQALGGYPPPKLTWWIGTRRLRPYDEANYSGVSKSTLRVVPKITDDGRYLTCRAENMALHGTSMEDQWHLQVHYAPLVSLRLGRNLDADNLRTGNDVYFECDVKANPQHLRLEWLHKGQLLYPNPSKGIIMSTQSLVLQRVQKESVGDYVCRAVNAEGAGESNAVPLKIMYAPICASQMVDQLIGVTAEENISINCRVDAYPPVVTFSWYFNNSDHREELSSDRFTSNGLLSALDFAPSSNQDYGTLFCQGENVIGRQEEPCAFQIMPTGRPAPLTDCQIFTNSSGSNQSLKESFQVYEGDELRSKVTNQQPNFEVNASPMLLQQQQSTTTSESSGGGFKLFVFAQNAKGSSEPFILEETFSKLKQSKHSVEGVTDSKAVTGSKSTLDLSASSASAAAASSISSIVVIVTGIICGIILTSLIICILVTCQKRRPSSSDSSSSGSVRHQHRHRGETGKRPRGDNDQQEQQQQQQQQPQLEAELGLMRGGYTEELYLPSRAAVAVAKGSSLEPDLIPIQTHGYDTQMLLPPPPPATAAAASNSSCRQDLLMTDLDTATLLSMKGPHSNLSSFNWASQQQQQQQQQQQHHYLQQQQQPVEWLLQPPYGQQQQRGGTLGRHQSMRSTDPQQLPADPAVASSYPYPRYHTCERQKKKVTIVEDKNTESSV